MFDNNVRYICLMKVNNYNYNYKYKYLINERYICLSIKMCASAGPPTQSQNIYFGRDIQNKWPKSSCRYRTDDLYF